MELQFSAIDVVFTGAEKYIQWNDFLNANPTFSPNGADEFYQSMWAIQYVVNEYEGTEITSIEDANHRNAMMYDLVMRLTRDFGAIIDEPTLIGLLNKRMKYMYTNKNAAAYENIGRHIINCPLSRHFSSFANISRLYAGLLVKYDMYEQILDCYPHFNPNGADLYGKYHRMWAVQTIIESYEDDSLTFLLENWEGVIERQSHIIQRLVVEFNADINEHTMWLVVDKQNRWARSHNLTHCHNLENYIVTDYVSSKHRRDDENDTNDRLIFECSSKRTRTI
jgi:hypothetical protein